MSLSQSRYLIIVVVSLLLVLAIFNFSKKPVPRILPLETEPQFYSYSAYSFMNDYEKLFQQNNAPANQTHGDDQRSDTGNNFESDSVQIESREAATWLRSRFFDFRLPSQTQKTSAVTKGEEKKSMENVYALSAGSVYPDEYIVVVSSYSNPDTSTSGDNKQDKQVAVAVNTELARIFSGEEHNRSIIFLFADSGREMEGVKAFIREFGEKEKIKAVLVVEDPSVGPREVLELYPAGLKSGYAPLWLREAAVVSSGLYLDVQSYSLFQEWAIRAFNLTNSAAGPFLMEDIPAIPFRLFFREPVDLKVIESYGRALEHTIRLIDEAKELPESSPFYLKSGKNFLTSGPVTIIQLLFILPLCYALYLRYRHRSRMSGFTAMLKREVLRWFKIFIAGTAAYLLLRLTPIVGMAIPYSDFILTESAFAASGISLVQLILILGAIPAAVFIALTRIFRNYTLPLSWDWEGAQLFILMGTAFIYILSLLTGTALWATSILLPSLYLWPLIKEGRERWTRYSNLIFILPGAIFFLVFLSVFAGSIGVSPVCGYLIVAALYGLICPFKILLFTSLIALYIMAVTLAWHSSPPETINEAGLNR